MFGKWSRFIVVSLVVLLFFCEAGVVLAYDFGAAHPDLNAETDVNETKSKIWNTVRSWGFSEAATAAMMGNIEAECSYNYNCIEAGRGFTNMANFEYGKYGIGLIQWTYKTRQEGLFAVCDLMGVQWTNLDAQLYRLKEELNGGTWWNYGGNYASIDEFKATEDLQTATDVICWGFERPNELYAHLDRRRNSAVEAYNQFSGSEITLDTNTGVADSSGNVYNVDVSTIVSEWDLVGMKGRSGLLRDSNRVVLPEYSHLNATEKGSLGVIKDNIISNKAFYLFDTMRVMMVFLGLCVVVYSVVFCIAYLFDKTNNIFDLSLVSIVSLGLLKYSYETENKKMKGYVNTGKAIKISLLCLVTGLFIISGGVFSVITRIILAMNGVG